MLHDLIEPGDRVDTPKGPGVVEHVYQKDTLQRVTYREGFQAPIFALKGQCRVRLDVPVEYEADEIGGPMDGRYYYLTPGVDGGSQ